MDIVNEAHQDLRIPLYAEQSFRCLEKTNSSHLLRNKNLLRTKTEFQQATRSSRLTQSCYKGQSTCATVLACPVTLSASLTPNSISVTSKPRPTKSLHFWQTHFNFDWTIPLWPYLLTFFNWFWNRPLIVCFQTWWFNTASANEFTIDWTVVQSLYVVF